EGSVESGEVQGADGMGGARLVVSPRLSAVELEPDVAAGFDAALETCRSMGAEIVDVPVPAPERDVSEDYLAILWAELAAWHQRFDERRERYRPSLREWVEQREGQGTSAMELAAAHVRRGGAIEIWRAWFDDHRVDAVIEPTVPVVAWERGDGYDRAGSDVALISLTSY